MRKTLAIVAVAGLLGMVGYAVAQNAAKQEAAPNAPKSSTITGEVIETSCYVTMGAKGEGHKQCALNCVKNGHSLALLEDGTGNIYNVVAPIDQNPSTQLLNFVAEHVSVKGEVFQKGGQTFIKADTIEKVKS